MGVKKARWWRRRRMLAALSAFAAVVVAAGVAVAVLALVNKPALSCGAGMTANTASSACVGINLDSDRISPGQPDRLGDLLGTIKQHNAAITGTNYVGVVLLLDLSPIPDLDTISYDVVYQGIEGAITAVWRANYTAAFTASRTSGEEPKVKLFLANMGSRNADWEKAVDGIAAGASANHITAVVGLGQSTDNTRWAATKLTTTYHLPVIGATVTGDTMNLSMADQKTLLTGFFRVSPTNSDTVSAAARYITQGLKFKLGDVAVVEDAVTSDDYVATLVRAAHKYLTGAHRFPFTSPDINTDSKRRAESLSGQFGYLDINLCAAHPKVVYFAGRGADITTFVRTWNESSTGCAGQPLLVLTGDDGIEAVGDDYIARAVAGSGIKVQYTGLASPGKWGACPQPPVNGDRVYFDRFRATFTAKQSCDTNPPTAPPGAPALPAYADEDLDNGQAMLTHDATGLALTAARLTGPSALTDPASQVGILQQTRCKTVFHGAGGTVRFSADRAYHGNPVGSILPIQNITKDRRAETVPPGWSTGGPSPSDGC